MTVMIKMKDELEPFPIKPSLKEFAGDLNIAFAAGKNFVVVEKEDGNPRMIAVHNVSYADDLGEDTGAIW